MHVIVLCFLIWKQQFRVDCVIEVFYLCPIQEESYALKSKKNSSSSWPHALTEPHEKCEIPRELTHNSK